MADTELLSLEIATPVGLALSTECESIAAPSVEGEFGVFAGHLPLLAALRAGVIKYRVDGKDLLAAVGPGFVEAGAAQGAALDRQLRAPGRRGRRQGARGARGRRAAAHRARERLRRRRARRDRPRHRVGARAPRDRRAPLTLVAPSGRPRSVLQSAAMRVAWLVLLAPLVLSACLGPRGPELPPTSA
ncbi:MAG: hypothetical protein M5U28_14820 [Sandaracinaceae bacterium]|nr:hypothetical protein [Sandaracinaceae bacterium]